MRSDKKTDAAKILRLYLYNRYALKTEEQVQEWLAINQETEELEQVSKAYWDSINQGSDGSTFVALNRVNSKIGFHSKEKKMGWFKTVTRVAAIFILLIGISGVWYYLQHQDNRIMVEVSAVYGEMKQVTLPDQTEVWLNAGSTLEYPSEFDQKIRSVRLTGEAFFSVTKNQTKPFVVETKRLTVRVLGTKFNLKAYSDEPRIVATLQEGKIEIQTDNQQKQKMMPNEQMVYNSETSELSVVKINPENIPTWKDGNLSFTEANMGEILQTLKRHFNIAFDIDHSIDLSTEYYTIKFKHDESAEQILQVLADVAGDFSYSVKNGQIVLHKK